MLHFRSIHWLVVYCLFNTFYVRYTTTTWPSLVTSNIQVLGLFQDEVNATKSETTILSNHTRAMFKAAIILSQQLNITIDGQLIDWQVAQTGGTLIGAVISSCEVLSTFNVVGIVGPDFSREASVMADVAWTVGVPTVSYGATDPRLSDKTAYPAFYRTIPSDSSAALAITKLFLQYHWTSCIIIYQNDDFGIGGADAISQAFHKNKLTVITTLQYDISTKTLRGDLKTTLLSSPTRIVILWAEDYHTSIILQHALDNNVLGPQFLWIISSSIALDTFNQTYYPQLIGVLAVEAATAIDVSASINRTLLDAAYHIWQQYEPETFPGPTNVHDSAYFAFDATWSIIESLQKLCFQQKNCLAFKNTTFCYGRRFLNASTFFNLMSATQFLGVSGPVQFSNYTTDRMDGTYYIARNVQPSANGIDYVSVLRWSSLNNWQIATGAGAILWPGGSVTPPNGLPVLNGIKLRICVILVSPFTMEKTVIDSYGNKTTKLVGYAIDLIDYLQKNMTFIPEIIVAPANQPYDQIIQGVANDIYDLIVSDVTITSKRREIVDFSNSIFDNSLRVIIRQGGSVRYDLFDFMKPFSPRLWLLILAALLYAAILFCIVERHKNEALKRKRFISAAILSLWFSFATLVGYGADFDVRTAAGRLLTVGLYILSIILVASYTANLASDLSVSKVQPIISGVDDIKNGALPYIRIGITVGSAVEDYYLREISDNSRNFYPLKSQNDIYPCLLNNTIDAAISDTGLLEYATNTIYCNLTLVGSDFNANAYGIVTRKQWLYAQALDINILYLRETGVLDTLKRKWFDANDCLTASTIDTSTRYPIEALAGLFFTFFIISLLSMILYGWIHRLIIKNYFMVIVHRTGWLFKRTDSPLTRPSEIISSRAQLFRSRSISTPELRY